MQKCNQYKINPLLWENLQKVGLKIELHMKWTKVNNFNISCESLSVSYSVYNNTYEHNVYTWIYVRDVSSLWESNNIAKNYNQFYLEWENHIYKIQQSIE